MKEKMIKELMKEYDFKWWERIIIKLVEDKVYSIFKKGCKVRL